MFSMPEFVDSFNPPKPETARTLNPGKKEALNRENLNLHSRSAGSPSCCMPKNSEAPTTNLPGHKIGSCQAGCKSTYYRHSRSG